MKNLFIISLIVLFIILLIIYIINYFKKPKTKEGFGLGDIDGVVDKINNVVDMAGQIPAKLENIDDRIVGRITDQLNPILDSLQDQINDSLDTAKNQIENNVLDQVNKLGDKIQKNVFSKIEDLGNDIKKTTVDLVTNKFVSFFKQLGDVFDDGLIKPFAALFEGLGNIFVQLFGILKLIGNKIASLPSCTVIFAIQSSIDIMFAIYNRIMPSFLKPALSFLYRYTIGLIFYFIGYITGYTDAVKSCYGFNVNEEVDKMNKNAGDIRKAFAKSWGLDFSKIKI